MIQELVREFIRDSRLFTDIVDFIESPLGLSTPLFPIQKFVIKLSHGIPLSRNTYIDVYDEVRSKILYRLNEHEYLKFLYEERRCNHKVDPVLEFKEVIWRGGRRGTKTVSLAFITAWALYKLLQLEDPHAHYNILPSTDIRFANVANSNKQSEVFAGEFKAHIRSKEFFSKYWYRPRVAAEDVRLYTKKELKQIESGFMITPMIRVDAMPCNSSHARGGNNMFVIFDEFAHFSKVMKSTRSDEEMYNSLTPSVAAFGSEGKIFMISSPLGPSGKMFELSEQSFKDPSLLMLEIPSWEINPNLTQDFLEARIRRSRNAFLREFGAKYVASVSDFIEEDSILQNCTQDFSHVFTRPQKQYYFYYGIDLGFVNDGTGITISHIENKKIYVDHSEGLYAKEGQFFDYAILSHDAIIGHLKVLFREYPPYKGLYDQWEGYGFEASLKKHGIHNFELVRCGDTLNSQMYKTLYSLMCNKDVFFSKDLKNLFNEMIFLQKEQRSKNIIRVGAPLVGGYHDDISDSMVRSVWLAYQEGILQQSPEVTYHSPRELKAKALANYARRILIRGRL